MGSLLNLAWEDIQAGREENTWEDIEKLCIFDNYINMFGVDLGLNGYATAVFTNNIFYNNAAFTATNPTFV